MKMNKYTGKPIRCKKLTLYKLSHYIEHLKENKLLRTNYNRTQPHKRPEIIYINRENTLCQAHSNYTFQNPQITQLCTSNKRPTKFNNLSDEHIFERMKSDIPIPYIPSSCRNYIVCS